MADLKAETRRTRDELAQLVEKARAERFRLLEVLHRAREGVEGAGVAGVAGGGAGAEQSTLSPDATETARLLTSKMERLSTAMAAKVDSIRAAERRADGRIAALERLEMKLENLAARSGDGDAAGAADLEGATAELEALAGIEAEAREVGAGIAEDVRRKVSQAVAQADKLEASFEAKLNTALEKFEQRLNATVDAAHDRMLERAVQFEGQMNRLSDKFDEQADAVVDGTVQRTVEANANRVA